LSVGNHLLELRASGTGSTGDTVVHMFTENSVAILRGVSLNRLPLAFETRFLLGC
jgi:hypothetical protein